MHKIAFAVLLLMLGIFPALAGEPKEDAYIACIVGNAVVGMNDGMTVNDAQERAANLCDSLYPYKPGDEEDGLADFLYHLLWDISESSMLPPQPDNAPMDIGVGN